MLFCSTTIILYSTKFHPNPSIAIFILSYTYLPIKPKQPRPLIKLFLSFPLLLTTQKLPRLCCHPQEIITRCSPLPISIHTYMCDYAVTCQFGVQASGAFIYLKKKSAIIFFWCITSLTTKRNSHKQVHLL